MKTKVWFLVLAAMLICAAPAFADIDQALVTLGEGLVEFPVGLVKIVGGIVWTVGEAIALPFRMLF